MNETTPLVALSKFPKHVNANNIMSVTDQRSKVDYVVEDHYAILTQMNGSILPRVLPYCLCNTFLALIIYICKHYFNNDYTFSSTAHNFMSLMISFLVITRCSALYYGWMEKRSLLNNMMKSFRNLIQFVVTFTRYDTSPKAAKWRSKVTRQATTLLRVMIAVFEYDDKKKNTWQLEELNPDEKKAILHSVGAAIERAPTILVLFVRTLIASHVKYLHRPLDVNEELKLLDCVSDALSMYYSMMIGMNTPYPFPLAQMGRTFLFIYVFSLPFSLDHDVFDNLVPYLLTVFVLTYGLLGMEFLNFLLGDPFKSFANTNNPLEFDCLELAKVTFDDMFITIQDVDGIEAANALRDSISNKSMEYEDVTLIKQDHQLPTSPQRSLSLTNTIEGIRLNSSFQHPNKNHHRRKSSTFYQNSSIFDGATGTGKNANDSDAEIVLFDNDSERITFNVNEGKVISSRNRSWTKEFKDRAYLL